MGKTKGREQGGVGQGARTYAMRTTPPAPTGGNHSRPRPGPPIGTGTTGRAGVAPLDDQRQTTNGIPHGGIPHGPLPRHFNDRSQPKQWWPRVRAMKPPCARHHDPKADHKAPARLPPGLTAPDRTLVLVGLMGAGKTSVGRKLAARLGLPFIDADQEIEKAAGCSIADIFQRYGEASFREGERRVIARLLDQPPHVLSTGGGAFMDPGTREQIAAKGLSIWLRAELDLLVARTARRDTRPLLRQGNPREVLAGLIEQRHPLYAQAAITVDSGDRPTDATVDRVLAALAEHQARTMTPAPTPTPTEPGAP